MNKLLQIAKANMTTNNYAKLELQVQLEPRTARAILQATVHVNNDVWGQNRQGRVSIDRRLIAYINGIG